MVPAALGTDTGGSVRTPSAWCGVVGLKTTHRVLPVDGIIPTAHSLDTVGPIVRSVADAALLFDLMAGRETSELDRHLDRDVPLDPSGPAALPGSRLGALPAEEREGMDDAVLDLYDAALDRLRSLGAEIEVFEPPAVIRRPGPREPADRHVRGVRSPRPADGGPESTGR